MSKITKFEVEIDLMKKERLEFLNDLKTFLDEQTKNYIVRLLGCNMIVLDRDDLK